MTEDDYSDYELDQYQALAAWIYTPGQQLRALRAEHSQRLADVSQATGLSVSYLNDLEHERTEPSLATLRRLVEHFRPQPAPAEWTQARQPAAATE